MLLILGSALGGIGGAIGTGIGLATAGRGGRREYEKAVEAWQKLQTSDFDFRSLSAPELRLVAEYFPEEYTAAVPEEARLAADSEAGRGAQLEAIDYARGVRDEGLPIETRLAAEEAQRAVAREAALSDDVILEELQRRGRLGGGEEIAARVGGGQLEMNLARDLGNDLARREIEARLAANADLAGIGSQERGQTIGLGQFNANAVNRFNEWVSQQQNQAQQANAMARERAQQGNVGNRQRLAESNVLNRSDTDWRNRQREDALKSEQFGQNYARTQGLAGAYGALGQQRDLARAEQIRMAGSLGQGIGQGVGGIGDVLGTGGLLGSNVQGIYKGLYGRR